MIYLHQIKNKNYKIKCSKCSGIGIVAPHSNDPRPTYCPCDVCSGTGEAEKTKTIPSVSERK